MAAERFDFLPNAECCGTFSYQLKNSANFRKTSNQMLALRAMCLLENERSVYSWCLPIPKQSMLRIRTNCHAIVWMHYAYIVSALKCVNVYGNEED